MSIRRYSGRVSLFHLVSGGLLARGVARDTEAPTVPGSLAASSITATTLTLTWNAASDNVGVVSYEVEQALDGDAFAWLATVAAPTVTLDVTGLAAGTAYRFRVRALDAAGNTSSWGPDDTGLLATTTWSFVAPTVSNGEIRVILSDGAGGWYIGGSWTEIIDSVATYTTGYTRLCHLLPNGTINAAFSCPAAGEVLALALDATGLYVGGEFSGVASIGGVQRDRIARVRPASDVSPGAVDAWRVDAGSTVRALVLNTANSKLYMGGRFSTVGSASANFVSTTRGRIARVTTGASATLDSWRCDLAKTTGSNNVLNGVYDLLLSDGKLYIGGLFDRIGGTGSFTQTHREGVARVTTEGVSPTLDVWFPRVAQTSQADAGVLRMCLDVGSSRLFVVGSFNYVGGVGDIASAVMRNHAACITTGTNATLDAWNPSIGIERLVNDIQLHPNGTDIVLCGDFVSVGGSGTNIIPSQTRNRVMALSKTAPATLSPWNPNAPGVYPQTVRRVAFPTSGHALLVGAFASISNNVVSSARGCAGVTL